MGMYGVSEFAAIINPPQAAILAVAAGQQRPVVKDGAAGDRHGDDLHAVASITAWSMARWAPEWLAAFKRIVEDPLSLML